MVHSRNTMIKWHCVYGKTTVTFILWIISIANEKVWNNIKQMLHQVAPFLLIERKANEKLKLRKQINKCDFTRKPITYDETKRSSHIDDF